MRRWWVGLLSALTLFGLSSWVVDGRHGLTRLVSADADPATALVSAHVTGIDLEGFAGTAVDRTDVTVIWRGAWDVPASDLYTLVLESGGRASWLLDGQTAVTGMTEGSSSHVVWLNAGLHAVEIRYHAGLGQPRLEVLAARAGDSPTKIREAALRLAMPGVPWLRQIAVIVRGLTGIGLVVLLAIAVRRASATVGARWRERRLPVHLGRVAIWFVLAVVLAYGALLRLDAITARYGPVSFPSWLAAIQTRTVLEPTRIRPAWFPWIPAGVYEHKDEPASRYFSDPYSYLKLAREMRSFYEPSWVEPLFPDAVRVSLRLLRDQSVAVSFASAAFSVLGIWFTYLLGAAVWSRPAGIAAASALAIDRDVAWFASQGWRDDAYVAAVALGAVLILRCWRVARQEPRQVRIGSWRLDAVNLETIALGAAAGLFVLTRIMAFSFLIPAAVVILASMRGTWRRRVTAAALGLAAAWIVAGPYFINCWRVHGDVFYTFNVHGNVYRVAEGKPRTSGGTLSYVRDKVSTRPFAALDTIASGLTTYPFSNKWQGLDAWRSGLGALVSALALAGLTLLAFTPAGRFVILVGVTSLVPFALTWQVDPNPRFTLHALPIFLVAAAVALSVAARFVSSILAPSIKRPASPWMRDRTESGRWNALAGAGTVLVSGAFIWFVLFISPQLVFAEVLRSGEPAGATAQSTGFFGQGWSRPVVLRNIATRIALGAGEIDLRLPAVGDYTLALTLESFPTATDPAARLPVVDYVLNGTVLGTLPLQGSGDCNGWCEVTLPRSAVRSGINRLVLRPQLPVAAGAPATTMVPGLTEGGTLALRTLQVSIKR